MENFEYIQQLIALKNKGDNFIKEYKNNENLPFIIYKDYVLSYCIEKTPLKLQKTLGISRIDREKFKLDDCMDENILKIFPSKTPIYFNAVFPKRGFTYMVLIND